MNALPILERSIGVGFKAYIIEIFKKRERILDVGCGIGIYLEVLGERGIGVDISHPDLKVAKEKGLKVIRIDANRKLPFKDHSFDTVLLSHVLEHVYSPIELLRESYRVLSDGGITIVGLPVENSLSNLSGRDSYYSRHEGHLYSFSLENIKILLKKVGFVVENKTIVEPWPAGRLEKIGLLNITKRLMQFLPSSLGIFLSNGYWVIGSKDKK